MPTRQHFAAAQKFADSAIHRGQNADHSRPDSCGGDLRWGKVGRGGQGKWGSGEVGKWGSRGEWGEAEGNQGGSRPVSRVLSRTVIPLGRPSPDASSSLPGCDAGRIMTPLFGLAPGGVYPATHCCQARGALLPHHFTLTWATAGATHRRYIFCGTFRRLTPPRNYLAPCPTEPGLSSTLTRSDGPADSRLPFYLGPRPSASTHLDG